VNYERNKKGARFFETQCRCKTTHKEVYVQNELKTTFIYANK